MARGKAAAKNANRRAVEAEDRLNATERRLAEQRASHRAERESLLSELQAARNALTSEVDKRAAQVAARAIADADDRLREARLEYESRARVVLDKVFRRYPDIPVRLVIDVAEALGVPANFDPTAFNPLDPGPNRGARRMLNNNKGLRHLNAHLERVGKSGRPEASFIADRKRDDDE